MNSLIGGDFNADREVSPGGQLRRDRRIRIRHVRLNPGRIDTTSRA